jgi:hypothetical protein
MAAYARKRRHAHQFVQRALAQQRQQVALVLESLIHRGRRGSRGARHRSHGQRFFSALAPQFVGSIEDSIFQLGVGFSRHGGSAILC